MSIFDSLMGQAGNIDIDGLAAKVGLDPAELRTGAESMLSKLASGDHDAQSASVATSAETGIDPTKLQALLPELSSAFGGEGEGGLAGKLQGLLGEGGASGALGELGGFAKGLFGKS